MTHDDTDDHPYYSFTWRTERTFVLKLIHLNAACSHALIYTSLNTFAVLNCIFFPCVKVVPITVLRLRFHMTRSHVLCMLMKISVSVPCLWMSFVIKLMCYMQCQPNRNVMAFFVTATKLTFCNLRFTFEKVSQGFPMSKVPLQSKKGPYCSRERITNFLGIRLGVQNVSRMMAHRVNLSRKKSLRKKLLLRLTNSNI